MQNDGKPDDVEVNDNDNVDDYDDAAAANTPVAVWVFI